MGQKNIDIYQYIDHQEYLKDWLSRPSLGPEKRSLKWLADKIGLKSKGYAHRILHSPAKSLSRTIQERLIPILGLSPAEAEYFRAMVAFASAHKNEDRARFFSVMRRFLGVRESGKLLADRYDYLSCWWLPALREIAVMKDWKNDYAAMAQQFAQPISSVQVQKGIELLLRLGFLQRGPRTSFRQAEPVLRTEDDVLDVAVYNYHKEQLALSQKALELSLEQRELGGITFGVPKGSYQKLRKRLREFQQSILMEFGSLHGAPEEILQVNFQLFFLTKP